MDVVKSHILPRMDAETRVRFSAVSRATRRMSRAWISSGKCGLATGNGKLKLSRLAYCKSTIIRHNVSESAPWASSVTPVCHLVIGGGLCRFLKENKVRGGFSFGTNESIWCPIKLPDGWSATCIGTLLHRSPGGPRRTIGKCNHMHWKVDLEITRRFNNKYALQVRVSEACAPF